jgi:hypothetical protein
MPKPPTAYMHPSGPMQIWSSSLRTFKSYSLLHFPFFKSKQSNRFKILPLPPPLPPQKYIFDSRAQVANPLLAFYILKGKVLNKSSLTLNSSISLVRCPSLYFPPRIKILLLEIAIAENLVRGVCMLLIGCQI